MAGSNIRTRKPPEACGWPIQAAHQFSSWSTVLPPQTHYKAASSFRLPTSNPDTRWTNRRLLAAARRVLADSRFESAKVSLAVVDDPTIHALNRRFLHHDWPTDVLSFALGADESRVKGEVVLSADTAVRVAAEGGWEPADEQLLYVIHGTLHLVGLDDQSDAATAKMRAAENYYLRECGVALDGIAGAVRHGRAGERGRERPLVNVDALFWIAIVSLAVSSLAAIGARVLQDFSRHHLQEICEQRQKLDRFGEIVRSHR